MIAALAIFIILSSAAIGLGGALLHVLTPAVLRHRPAPVGFAGLVGLFVVAICAATANFFVPVTWHLSAVLLGLGLGCFAYNPRWLDRFHWGVLLVGSAVFVLMTGPQYEGYDGGLYHLPAQLWLVQEKIVLGLANLHGRFGFNSLNEALLAVGWLPDDDLIVARLLAGLYGLFFVLIVFDVARSNREYPDLQYLGVSLGAFFGFNWAAVSIPMGWTNTDAPAAVAALSSILAAYTALRRSDRDMLVLSFLLAAFTIALKTSVVTVALIPLAVAGIMWKRGGWSNVPALRIAALALFVLPWVARSFLLSGCLAYPAAVSCLPVPWAATDNAINDAQWIVAWARAPNTGLVHLTGWSWLPIWFDDQWWTLAQTLIAAVAGMVIAILLPRHTIVSVGRDGPLIVSLWAILASVLWFLTAPAGRFGMAQLMTLGSLPGMWITVLTARASVTNDSVSWRPVVVVAIGLFSAVALPANRPSLRPNLLEFGPLKMGPIAINAQEGINRPVAGDRCFLAPTPCSPEGTTRSGEIGSYRAFLP